MATLAELTARRDALEAALDSGQRRVRVGNVDLEFRSGAEMEAALAGLNRRISEASGTPARVIRVHSSKGL